MTNVGMVLPEPGYLAGVRELTRKYDTLLIIDETHTFSAGWGGMTTRDNLEPDVFIIGKAIAGGIPTGTYGLSAELAARVLERTDLDLVDMGGVGGTLAGNPLQVAAMRATLEKVLTKEAFAAMIALCDYYTDGVQALFDKYDLPWSINQLGTRAEYRFAKPYPINGTDAYNSADPALEDFLHLYLVNRGIMLTPFHNMALMCPTTSKADIDRHQEVFEAAIMELLEA
jgi:glutamate-1-semialdehyde 2,1-aminomutase